MTSPPATTVFGLPAYNGEKHLAEALESLLTQTRRDLAVIVVDDASTDQTEEIVRRYAALDPRISYERNERTLGLVHNWRRVLELAVERHPSAWYFAWASDHDVWHPRWLEALTGELEDHPEAVLAYPRFVRMDDAGAEFPVTPSSFDTVGVTSPTQRLRQTIRHATAGGTIYGLIRVDALERCGAFPLVILPDRLYVARLALEGEFRQVSRRLWYRRYRFGVVMSFGRQRRAFFPDGVPWWTHLPWWLVHPVVFVSSLERRPRRLRLGAAYLLESAVHQGSRWRAHREIRRRRRRRSRGRPGRSRLARRAPGMLLRRLGLRAPATRPKGQSRPPVPSAGASADPREERAFAVYERVRDEVSRMIVGSPGELHDLFGASPETVAALRRQAGRIGGASPEAYDLGDEAGRHRHARKLAALERIGGDLVVREPALLGGFGFELDGGLVNLDTLRFSEVLIALERAELLREIASEGVLVEFGGGWGGLAYHLKARFPELTYVIVDRPERFLFSAVYLLSAFPDARAVFWDGDPAPLDRVDFVFVPEGKAGLSRSSVSMWR